MKTFTILSLVGTALLAGPVSASADELIVASLFGDSRQALDHNCAEARATSGNDFEIITQCGPGNR